MESQAQEFLAQSLVKVRGQAGKHLFWLRHPATVDLGRWLPAKLELAGQPATRRAPASHRAAERPVADPPSTRP
jgi:hypothetical protein